MEGKELTVTTTREFLEGKCFNNLFTLILYGRCVYRCAGGSMHESHRGKTFAR